MESDPERSRRNNFPIDHTFIVLLAFCLLTGIIVLVTCALIMFTIFDGTLNSDLALKISFLSVFVSLAITCIANQLFIKPLMSRHHSGETATGAEKSWTCKSLFFPFISLLNPNV